MLAQPGPRIGTSGSEKSRQQSHSKLVHLQYLLIGFWSSSLTIGTSVISADVVSTEADVEIDDSVLSFSIEVVDDGPLNTWMFATGISDSTSTPSASSSCLI
jgi:hypothetical protein